MASEDKQEMLMSNSSSKWIKHYSDFHKILLVGEGDFSFALSLAKAFGCASNIVATSLDSQAEVVSKYADAQRILSELKAMGCTLFHEVDVHTMTCHPFLSFQTFDRIVFNFPHAPLNGTLNEEDLSQILAHQELVKGFMTSACKMVSENGEVHVTHKTTPPFSYWDIEGLAVKAGLRKLVGKERFSILDYPCYRNKKGCRTKKKKKGYWKYDDWFPIGQCCTFKFALC